MRPLTVSADKNNNRVRMIAGGQVRHQWLLYVQLGWQQVGHMELKAPTPRLHACTPACTPRLHAGGHRDALRAGDHGGGDGRRG